MAFPDFNERDGDPQIPPPYSFKDVTIWSFGLEVDDSETINTLIDEHLNMGPKNKAKFDYQWLRWYVAMEVLTYKTMKSQSKLKVERTEFSEMGYCYQNELYFRLLVGRYEQGGNGWDHKDTAIFVPYIFVDNNWSVITGREVIGYPKVWAKIDTPTPGQDYPITVSTDVFEKYDPGTKQALRKLVEIDAIDATASAPSDISGVMTWPWGEEVNKGFFPRNDSVKERNTVQLKQFRDAKDGTRACYKALVGARFTVTRRDLKPLAPAKITIHPFDSLPIVKKLGLGSGKLTPVWQYKVKCDLEIDSFYNILEQH